MREFKKVIRCINYNFEMPKRSTSGSAGYDFYNPEKQTIEPHKIAYIKTGIKAYMYDDEVLLLYNRSSNPKKKGLILINGVGVVDSDYVDNIDNEGEIAFAFYNITDEPITLEANEKLGQGIFTKWFRAETDIEEENIRNGGFGSTGI